MSFRCLPWACFQHYESESRSQHQSNASGDSHNRKRHLGVVENWAAHRISNRWMLTCVEDSDSFLGPWPRQFYPSVSSVRQRQVSFGFYWVGSALSQSKRVLTTCMTLVVRIGRDVAFQVPSAKCGRPTNFLGSIYSTVRTIDLSDSIYLLSSSLPRRAFVFLMRRSKFYLIIMMMRWWLCLAFAVPTEKWVAMYGIHL